MLQGIQSRASVTELQTLNPGCMACIDGIVINTNATGCMFDFCNTAVSRPIYTPWAVRNILS